MTALTIPPKKAYAKTTLAKSNVGIGVPNLTTGHTTAPSYAVFSCGTALFCLMVGVVGESLTRRFTCSRRYANPITPITLKLAFFGGRNNYQTTTGKRIMNTQHTALSQNDINTLAVSSIMQQLLTIKGFLGTFANLTADSNDMLCVNASDFNLAMSDITDRLSSIHIQLDALSLDMVEPQPIN